MFHHDVWRRFALGAAIILVLFGSSTDAFAARKLYVFIAADDNDPAIGKHCQQDRDFIKSIFDGNVAISELEFVNIAANSLNATGIAQAIGQKNIRSEDAVMFYYSGHGMFANDGLQYFETSASPGRPIRRNDIINLLRQRNPGLLVVVSDACFNFRKVDVAAAPMKGFPYQANISTKPLIKKLFFQTSGFVDVNSCVKGEQAGTNLQFLDGSIFTKHLYQHCEKNLMVESLTWDSLINAVATDTARSFNQMYPDGIGVKQLDGTTGHQQTQTVAKLAMDYRPFNPGSGSGTTPPSPTPEEIVEENVQIDPYTGNVTITVIYKSYNAATGQMFESRRETRNNQAGTLTATDGVQYWSYLGTYVLKKGGGSGGGGGMNNNGSLQAAMQRLGARVSENNGFGVRVDQVTPGTPATRLNKGDGQNWFLEPGDVISAFNDVGISSTNDFAQAVSNAQGNVSIAVYDTRTGQTMYFNTMMSGGGGGGGNNGGGGGGMGGNSLAMAQAKFGASVSSTNGWGVRVTNVAPGSSATRLNVGDGKNWYLEAGDLITVFNGRQINSVEDYAAAVNQSTGSVQLTVIGQQDGQTYQFQTWLGANGGNLPVPPQPIIPPGGGNAQTAVGRFGVDCQNAGNGQGVVVRTVVPNSAGHRMLDNNGTIWRLEPGDRIVRINGQAVGNVNQYYDLLQSSGKQMSVEVRDANGQAYYLNTTLAW